MIDDDEFDYFAAYAEEDFCICLNPYLEDGRCKICGYLWAPEDHADDEYY